MASNILANLFNRKKKAEAPAQPVSAPAAPAPAAPVPAAPAAPVAPLPSAAGDGIRNALDAMALRLISSPEGRIAAAGMRLQDMKNTVEDAPCDFPGYDEVILGAIGQMEILSQTCSEEQMNEHLRKLEEAIAARAWTQESTPAFQPSMKTQYYTLMLVGLQGRINAVEKTMAENNRIVSEIQAYPPEKKKAFEPNLLVAAAQNKMCQEEMESLFAQVAICRGGLQAAQTEMLHASSMPNLNHEEAFRGIYEQNREWQSHHEATVRSRNSFFASHKAELESMVESAVRSRAARKEELRQMEEINQMNTMLGIKLMEEEAQKLADLQQQVASDEAPTQAAHDVFGKEFTPSASNEEQAPAEASQEEEQNAAEPAQEEISPAAL